MQKPDLFEAWRSLLPKHREFKRTDRVCHRHFDPADIQTTWDHTINGKLVQMQRSKASLMPNALPSQNLLSDSEAKCIKHGQIIRAVSGKCFDKCMAPNTPCFSFASSQQMKSALKDTKRTRVVEQTTATSTRLDISPTTDDKTEEYIAAGEDGGLLEVDVLHEVHEIERLATDEESMDAVVAANEPDNDNKKPTAAKPTEEASAELAAADEENSFDCIYDDIYEIVLPDTMYGVHRDPEREYIVFSRFDIAQMASTKALRIDRGDLRTRSYIDAVECTDRTHAELTLTMVSEMLSVLDAQMLCDTLCLIADPDVIPPKCLRAVTAEVGQTCAGCNGDN